MIQKFWMWLFWQAVSHLRWHDRTEVANRDIRIWDVPKWKIEVVTTNKNNPDGYTRVELLQMLELIRKHEKIQGWKVPESES